jgi:hypothetical protein
LQPNVKKGAASKRCGCDPPPPEVAGLAPLHSLMDIFRRMWVIAKLRASVVLSFDLRELQAYFVVQWTRLNTRSWGDIHGGIFQARVLRKWSQSK